MEGGWGGAWNNIVKIKVKSIDKVKGVAWGGVTTCGGVSVRRRLRLGAGDSMGCGDV